MFSKPSEPMDTVFWQHTLPQSKPLTHNLETDIVVVGGGMAGLTAAQSFHERGRSVVVLEKNFCGSGASGKSSGFITPDAEYSLHDFVERFGQQDAHTIWKRIVAGVDLIKQNIIRYKIDCDYQQQDTVVFAKSKHTFKKDVLQEHKTRERLGYQSALYHAQDLNQLIHAQGYMGAVRYPGTFSINAYRYCQSMKQVLQDQGVQIYEDTQVTQLEPNGVKTTKYFVKAHYSIVCVDHFISELNRLSDQIYPVQTYLCASEPLSNQAIKSIFPENIMGWDTDLIYQYFRPTIDNRLLIGGANIFSSYAGYEQHHNDSVTRKLQRYVETHFPQITTRFEYRWPGLIGISKDIVPIAGRDKQYASIYYIMGAAGLPWAAGLAQYSAEHLLEGRTDMDRFVNPYRNFPLGTCFQSIMGNKITFALSNLKSLYWP